jgi:gliding motility-associated-like protein
MAAPDNKIYLNRSITKLSVIERPNVKGAGCNFQSDKIDLAGRSGGIGFPGFINDLSFDPYNNFSYQVVDSCSGILQFESQTNLPGSIQWEWDFGDGTSSTLQNPVHDFQQSDQLYYVKLKIKSTGSCGYVEKGKNIPSSGLYSKASFDFVSLCDSGYVRFINKSYTYPERNVEFLWDFGDGTFSSEENPIHVFDHSGLYTVNLKMKTGLQCLDDAVSVDLNFNRLVIDAHPDSIVIEEGQSIQMDVSGNGDVFFWSPSTWLSNPFIRNPIATPLKDISYVVVVKTNTGCLDADTVFVKVKNLNEVNVPTAFTPNNDGKNDVLRPRIGLLFTLDEFSIYNRWGQRIFTTHEPTKGWDGRVNGVLQSQGVFVWKLRAKDQHQKIIEKKGTVVLIR